MTRQQRDDLKLRLHLAAVTRHEAFVRSDGAEDCEECHRLIRDRRPAKRFCGERCRKRAGDRRGKKVAA